MPIFTNWKTTSYTQIKLEAKNSGGAIIAQPPSPPSLKECQYFDENKVADSSYHTFLKLPNNVKSNLFELPMIANPTEPMGVANPYNKVTGSVCICVCLPKDLWTDMVLL